VITEESQREGASGVEDTDLGHYYPSYYIEAMGQFNIMSTLPPRT